PALVGHFEEEQVRNLLDVVAVIDAVMAKRMAEAPQFLDDVGHKRFYSGFQPRGSTFGSVNSEPQAGAGTRSRTRYRASGRVVLEQYSLRRAMASGASAPLV